MFPLLVKGESFMRGYFLVLLRIQRAVKLLGRASSVTLTVHHRVCIALCIKGDVSRPCKETKDVRLGRGKRRKVPSHCSVSHITGFAGK